jgi:transcriptional regulator with XRE-family HTH domain
MPRNAVPGFGPRLKKLRDAAGLSQQQLADAAGTHPDSIVKLETGTRQPSLELAWRLATTLGVTVLDLLPEGRKKKSRNSA